MTVREFKITCPICQGTIVIDARAGKIIRHWEAGEKEKDKEELPDPKEFDDALEKVHRIEDEGDTFFQDAMKKVSQRKKGLDQLFKDAQEKAKDKGDQERPEDRRDFWD